MLVNFITNFPLDEISGGFSGMNAAAYEALAEIVEIHYVGPVNPPASLLARITSKVKRLSGNKGEFFFFSEARLNRIAAEVNLKCRFDAEFDFYHGFTPWIRCAASRPYFAWSDCCFQDYVDIYHPRGSFSAPDLRRICSAETEWMRRAEALFFSSNWGRLRTETHYGLRGESLSSVGIFGAVDVPAEDTYLGGNDFLFVSTDYIKKNGHLCRQAMNSVWREFPKARLNIVGAPPRTGDLNDDRVTFQGYLDKSQPTQLAAFTRLLSQAFALVHPTTADTTSMVAIEAAFHGCPSITVNDFALPEVTGGGKYAVLLDPPVTVDSLSRAMLRLLRETEKYKLLRMKAREFTKDIFSRGAFKARLQNSFIERVESFTTRNPSK